MVVQVVDLVLCVVAFCVQAIVVFQLLMSCYIYYEVIVMLVSACACCLFHIGHVL